MKETGKVKCKNIQKMIEEKADACPGLITEFEGITKDGKKIKKKYLGLNITDLLNKYNEPVLQKLSSKLQQQNLKAFEHHEKSLDLKTNK